MPYLSHSNPQGRFRKEQIDALMVWEEWQKSGLPAKKGFPKIASRMSIPLSTVKTRWYKAYSIINKKPYEPKKIKKELGEKAVELCSKCKDVTCYKDKGTGENMDWIPCYKYSRLACKEDQREKTMSEKQFKISHFGEIQEE